ncbi:A-kinase anchor protein 17B isoform X2 [Phoca vitulina]|uniref:A-kinase anchor protein 17B isoform X2 n=1 Tax=Phoca vitulina TaxID=9720 RepID=UPI0013964ED0|nr:A-kinase anchor protein 17B isoform X2 [Phoca vitulina]
MMVTVVYDNSEATELCAAQHLYLKPIAKLMINVLVPESSEPTRPFSNWEVLDQLKSLICPDQFTTVRLSKSTKDFIRFEGEAETRSLVQILKAKLHGKIIKLNGLKTDLKVVATDAQGEWERFPREKEASASDGAEEQDQDKSPDSIYFEGLPCKWFAPKGSSGEKPCEEILRVVFESFGKIKNVDIPMLDPYREVMTGGTFGGFSFGLQTFEAFIQYQESTDFVKAMESLRGMRLMLKGDDGKALACNIKVSTQFNPQGVDDASPKVNHAPGNTLETLKKEELNTQCLQNQEEMPKYQVAKSDNKRKQKMKKRTRAHLRKSSHHLGRKKIRYSARKERTGKLLTEEYNHSLVSDQNSLQNAMIQDQSLEKEDHCSSNKSDSSTLFEPDHGRKQKIYETDEFIDYLLNYYQTPKYARICLEPSHIASPCQWQRAVHAKGNGFQINLRKRKHHSTSLSQMQNLATRERVQEDDCPSEICTKDPEHKPQKRGKVDYAKAWTKELKDHCQDTASETGDHLSPADGKSHLLEKTQAYQVKDSNSPSQSPVSSPGRSGDLDLELTDFLEEISSDSECFSEILSINKEEKERSVATDDSSPEKRSLNDDEITTSDREMRARPQTSSSKWNRHGEHSSSKSKLRKPGERSKYEVRFSWLEGENSSSRGEKSTSKRRATLAPKYLFDEGSYHQSGPSSLLDHITRKRRRFGDSPAGRQVHYGPAHVPMASSQSAHVFYVGGLPQRRETPRKSEYNQEARRFKRDEHSRESMLNSGNYYIRHNSQEHLDYRSYFGNSYTSSLYFQMF